MLPAASRLRRRPEISAVVRRGRRGPRPSLVVHVDVTFHSGPGASAGPGISDLAPLTARPRVGFVVSRAVGPAVTRNTVRRRLRHLMAARLEALPSTARIVVRALPPAAGLSSRALAIDLDAALGRALTPRQVRA